MTKFKNLKHGTVLSEAQFYVVAKISGNEVQLTTDSGENVIIGKDYVEGLLVSADQYSSEKVVNKTEAAQIFLAASNIAVTVNFNTKVDAKVAKDAIKALYPNTGGKFASKADFDKKVNEAIKDVVEGKERTMVGRHFGELNDLGRVNFIDMEVAKDKTKTYDNRQRQVDPRTINWMVIKGIKYLVK